MEHGLTHISFYVQKHMVAMGMCYDPELVCDKPLGTPASVKLVYLGGPFGSQLKLPHLVPIRGLYLGRGSLLLVGPLFHFRQCHSGLVPSRNEHVCPCHSLTRAGS